MTSFLYANHPPYQVPHLPNLASHNCLLEVIQNPVEALVATEGKEKTRKPIDPPPIVELKVTGTQDHSQQWLQSPYLFMVASLHNANPDAQHENAGKALIGTLTSSLHRLKASDNRDGGFFIFGDVSVMIQGRFKLRFSLYEMQDNSSIVVFLGTVDSKPFDVLPAKEFKGMAESTVLSRSFSDQGVRLRLRKEPRGLSGNKRKFASFEESDEMPQRRTMTSEPSSSLEESSSSPNKRFQRDAEDRKDSLPAGSHINGTTYGTFSSPLSYRAVELWRYGIGWSPDIQPTTNPPEYPHPSSVHQPALPPRQQHPTKFAITSKLQPWLQQLSSTTVW
jgi:hypothetical protein